MGEAKNIYFTCLKYFFNLTLKLSLENSRWLRLRRTNFAERRRKSWSSNSRSSSKSWPLLESLKSLVALQASFPRSVCEEVHRSRSHRHQPKAEAGIAQILRGQEGQAFGSPQEIDACQETRSHQKRAQRQIRQRAEKGAHLAC